MKISISQKNYTSKKKIYSAQLSSQVQKIDKSKIFNYTKPYTVTSRELKLVEKKMNNVLDKSNDDLRLFNILSLIHNELSK